MTKNSERKTTKVLYHRTNEAAAKAIMQGGFIDSTTAFGGEDFTGVWMSNRPLDVNEGAKGRALLKVSLKLSEDDWKFFNCSEPGKTYDEWIIPASTINSQAKVEIFDEYSEI